MVYVQRQRSEKWTMTQNLDSLFDELFQDAEVGPKPLIVLAWEMNIGIGLPTNFKPQHCCTINHWSDPCSQLHLGTAPTEEILLDPWSLELQSSKNGAWELVSRDRQKWIVKSRSVELTLPTGVKPHWYRPAVGRSFSPVTFIINCDCTT